MSFIAKILAVIGLVALIGGAGWLLFNGYLIHAVTQRNPAVDIAEAANKIATDPFAKGPSLGNVLVVTLAIIGVLAILSVLGLAVYVIRTQRRQRQYTRRHQQQNPYGHPLARPQVASVQGGIGDALNALVQLEMARYLRGMHADQEGQPSAVLPPEQPIVVQQLGPDPVDDLLREL